MIDILQIMQSSLLGNSIGIISFLIGIISLIITVRTFNKTKLVEQEIQKIRSAAKDQVILNDYKTEAIEALQNKRSAIKETRICSEQMRLELIEITSNILSCSASLKPCSAELVTKTHEYLLTHRASSCNVGKLVDYLTKIENILKKGE